MRWSWSGVAGALVLALAPAWAEVVGTVEQVQGQVMVSPDAGLPFGPARVGQVLSRGGVVVVMEDAAATLRIEGRGELELADNAALRLEEAAGQGEFSTVTGVRAPVLFLYPVGRSEPVAPGRPSFTFGINHDLDKVRGLDRFRLYALHEDAEWELDEDAGVAAVVAASQLLEEFQARDDPAQAGYTWYTRSSQVDLDEEGDYTIFLVALRGGEPVRLGQSTLLLVEGPRDDE